MSSTACWNLPPTSCNSSCLVRSLTSSSRKYASMSDLIRAASSSETAFPSLPPRPKFQQFPELLPSSDDRLRLRETSPPLCGKKSAYHRVAPCTGPHVFQRSVLQPRRYESVPTTRLLRSFPLGSAKPLRLRVAPPNRSIGAWPGCRTRSLAQHGQTKAAS